MDIFYQDKYVEYSKKIRSKQMRHAQVFDSDTDVFDFGLSNNQNETSEFIGCSVEDYKIALKQHTGAIVKTTIFTILVSDDKIQFKYAYLTREHNDFPIRKKVYNNEMQRSILCYDNDIKIYCNKKQIQTKTITLDLKHNNVYVTYGGFHNRKGNKYTRTNDFYSIEKEYNIMTFQLNRVITMGFSKNEISFDFLKLFKKAFQLENIDIHIKIFSDYLLSLFDSNFFQHFKLSEFVIIWYIMRNGIKIDLEGVDIADLTTNGLLMKNVLGKEKSIVNKLAKDFNTDPDIVKELVANNQNADIMEIMTLYGLIGDINIVNGIYHGFHGELVHMREFYNRGRKSRKSSMFTLFFSSGYNGKPGYYNYLVNGWPKDIKVIFSDCYIIDNKGNRVFSFEKLSSICDDSFHLPPLIRSIDMFEKYFNTKLSGLITFTEAVKLSRFLDGFLYDMDKLYLNIGKIDKEKIKYIHNGDKYEIKPILRGIDFEPVLTNMQYHDLKTALGTRNVVLGHFRNRKLISIFTCNMYKKKFSKKMIMTQYDTKDVSIRIGQYPTLIKDIKLREKIDPIFKYYEKEYSNINYNINLELIKRENNIINKLLN